MLWCATIMFFALYKLSVFFKYQKTQIFCKKTRKKLKLKFEEIQGKISISKKNDECELYYGHDCTYRALICALNLHVSCTWSHYQTSKSCWRLGSKSGRPHGRANPSTSWPSTFTSSSIFPNSSHCRLC